MKKKIALFIFFSAFLIRLIALNQSLWADEGTTAKVVEQYSYTQIITRFSPTDFHPPFYYLMIKGWTQIFGLSEVSLRMPSIIFSLLTGWIIYLICRLRKSSGDPLWAAALFLFNPLIVYYSQEARMYMMATFFLTVALYYLVKTLKNDTETKTDTTTSLLFGIFASLAFLTFYGSALLIAAMLLYLLHQKKYKKLVISSFPLLFSFALISPLLFIQFNNSRSALINISNWSLVLGKASLKNLLLIPIKFAIGRIDFYPKWLYYLIAGSWTLFTAFQLLSSRFKLKSLFLFLFLLPLGIGFIVSFWSPLLQYFRFQYLIPILAIILSYSSRYKKILIVGFIIFAFVYLLIPQFYREDWKSLSAEVPSDTTVYMILSSSDTLKYYRKDLKIRDLRYVGKWQSDKNILIIPYTAEIYGLDYKGKLENAEYKPIKEKSYRGLSEQFWRK